MEFGNLIAGSNTGLSASSIFNIASAGVLSTGAFNPGVLFLTGSGIVQDGASSAQTLTIGANNTNSGSGFNGATSTFNGIIQDGGAGALSIVKAGYGIQVFSEGYNALNTYTGSTSVNSGILNVTVLADTGSASSIGTGTGAGATLNLGSNGQLGTLQISNVVSGNNESNRSITLVGGGTGAVDVIGNSGVVGTGSGFAAAVTTGDLVGALTTLSGNISGAGTLLKLGWGNLDLSGANSYTGGTVVDTGILRFKTAASVPASGVITVNSGGTVAAGGTGYGIDQTFLDHISSSSTGVVALGADSGNNLSFANLSNASLGATGHNVFSGTLTPGSNGYQLGGGGLNNLMSQTTVVGPNSVLFIANANTITGTNSVTVSAHGSQGAAVVFDDTQNFTGTLTVTGNLNAQAINASGGQFPSNGNNEYNTTLYYLSYATLTLAGGSQGTLPNVNGIVLNPMGGLNMIATASSADRLPNGVAINFNGGSLGFLNDGSSANFSENLGQMNLVQGNSEILANPAQAGFTSVLTFSNINRSMGATVEFAGSGLGASALNQIIITSTGTLSTSLALPWASYSASGGLPGSVDQPTDFASLTGTGGIRATAAGTLTTSGTTATVTSSSLVGGDYTVYNTTLNGTASAQTISITGTNTANTIRVTSPNPYNGGPSTVSPGGIIFALNGNGTLAVNGLMNANTAGFGTVNLTIGATIGDGTLTTMTGNNELFLDPAYTAQNGSMNIIINSNIANNSNGDVLNIVKTGNGNVTLSGTTNTYTGNIYVDGLGSLIMTNLNVFGTGSINVNSGSVQTSGLTAVTGTVISNNWNINNDAVIYQNNSTANVALTGTISLNNGTLFYISNQNVVSSLNGAIVGSGGLNLQGAGGTGILSLGGTFANTYTGLTTITGRYDGANQTIVSLDKLNTNGNVNAIAGNILLGVSGQTVFNTNTQAQTQEVLILGGVVSSNLSNDQINDASVITFQGGNGYDAGIFRLNNKTETIGGVQSMTAGDGLIQNNSTTTGASTLNLNTATGTNYTFSGLVQNRDNTNVSANFGTLAISKTGSGTQTFTNANTYTGGTTINAGSFYVNNVAGSATGTGSLTVASGATFGGTGIINSISDNNFNAGSTVLVGQANAIDTNTTKVLALNAANADNFNGANLVFNLSTISAGLVGQGDKITTGITSAVNFNGFNSNTFSFNVLGAGTIGNGTQFTLFSSATYAFTPNNSVFGGDIVVSGANNQISGINLNFINAQSTYGSSYLVLVDTSGGSMTSFDIDLVIGTAVPEPGTWAMMLGGLALLLIYHRAHRKNS